MLRSIARLERHRGFRPRLFQTRRDYLEYVEMVQIQGAERETWEGSMSPHKRWEGVLRRAGQGAREGPE